MIRRFRLLAAAAAVAAALTGSLVVPTATASAQPVQTTAQTKYFNIHIRLNDNYGDRSQNNCYRNNLFSREGSRCGKNSFYDPGHTAGFNNVTGSLYYGGIAGGTELIFTTTTGSTVRGTIPSRGSGDFTITDFTVPEFGTLARPGQKLHLNVTSEGFGLTGDAWQDFYLSGNLDIVPPPTGDNGGFFDDLRDALSGVFGSS
jgi:hypothetical protein